MKRSFTFSLWAVLCVTLLLSGCDMALFNPKGQIGVEQRDLILITFGLMCIVVIPVFVMTVLFVWRYRAKNTSAEYKPNWAHSNKIELVVWTIPCIIILILAVITWKTTHSLDPRQPIPSENPPVVIEVVSLDWQWLFIYPGHKIATINEITVPVDTPVTFKLTSQTVMNSFYIPRLGSQLYAMAGMENQLNLIANHEGVYDGVAANYNGRGFSDMKFAVNVTTDEQYQAWIAKVKASDKALTKQHYYDEITKPVVKAAVQYFYPVDSDLYSSVIAQYMHSHGKTAESDMPVNHNVVLGE